MTRSARSEPPVSGAQEPRLVSIPAYAGTSGEEATELAALAGLILDPWQQFVLRHSLGERADGKWAAFQVGLVVGRQNGKNAVLEARELAEVLLIAPLVGPRVVVHSAHQFKTSLEHFRRLKKRIKASPEILAKVKGPIRRGEPAGFKNSHGEEEIEFIDGSRIIFAARTKSGGQGRGFTADLLVWDEAMNLPDAIVGDVMPTVSARTGPDFLPGPQVWYTGSAVNQQTMPYGVQLARIREHGIEGDDPALFYAEWSVDEQELKEHPEMMDDPKAWAQANPGLGYRIAASHVKIERAGAMPPAEFLTERMGVGDWPPTTEEASRVISAAAWTAIADLGSRIETARMFALSVNPGQAWATLSAAGVRKDSLWHTGVVEHQQGISWIVERSVHYLEAYPDARLIIDPRADLADLLKELSEAGIPVIETSAHDYKDACGGFFQAVVDKRLRYRPPQPELDAAIAGATTQPLLDAWKWSWKSSAIITPLVSCTLALWGVRTQGAPEVWDLGEMIEAKEAAARGEAADNEDASSQPDRSADPPGFIRLEDMPRGGFR